MILIDMTTRGGGLLVGCQSATSLKMMWPQSDGLTSKRQNTISSEGILNPTQCENILRKNSIFFPQLNLSINNFGLSVMSM